jgi:8-oxo-dGTP diphosphatase
MPLTQQVAAKGLIRNGDGAILLLKRAKPYHGETVLRWDFPGGRVDPGESLRDALARELKEETGLLLKQTGPIIDDQDFQPAGAELQVFRFTLEAELMAEGPVALSDEHVDSGWWRPELIDPDEAAWQLIATLKAVGLRSDEVQ